MAPASAYDEIADWYEDEFLARTAKAGADVLGIEDALRELLGRGTGICLEIGCGTGARAAQVRALGWTSLGVDLSARPAGPLPAPRTAPGAVSPKPDPEPGSAHSWIVSWYPSWA